MINLEELGITKDDILEQTTHKLAESLQEELYSDIKQKIFQDLDLKIKETVNSVIENEIKDYTNLEYQPVNSWGKPIGQKTTIAEVMESSFINWWTTKVDRYGKPSNGSYGAIGTRAEYMTKKLVEETITSTLKNDFDKVIQQAKNGLKEALTKTIKQIVERNLK